MLDEPGEAILTVKHVQFCQKPCTPITTLSTEPLVELVSTLLDPVM